MGGPGVLADGGDRGPDLRVHRHGDGEPGAVAADRADERGGVVSRVRPDDDRSRCTPRRGRCRWPRRRGGRAAGGGGVAAAQPGRGDHRRGQRRADRRGQRVQPPDQQAFALDLGVAERGALLGVAVDPFLHRVDIEERQASAPGNNGARRASRPATPGDLLQLADVPLGVRAQVRSQRGRRADTAEQRAHRAVPQQVWGGLPGGPGSLPRTRRAPFSAPGSPVIYAACVTGFAWMYSWQAAQTMSVLRRILP